MSRRTRRRLLWMLAALAALVALVGFTRYRYGPWTPTAETADQVAAVEVWLESYSDEGRPLERLLARSEDPEAIRGLLRAMTPVTDVPAHKCGNSGRIEFVRKDGNRYTVGYLPGHNPDGYELVRPGDRAGWVRVPKPGFLAAVKAVGVTEFPVECGKPAAALP